MPAILEKHPDSHAVIVGGDHALEPDYPAFLKARIRELNLTDRIILTGLQHNVPEWMKTMDVVVHASENEPFGIVVIEAMALGKPVAATDTAGPAEIITDGINGLLWPARRPAALVSAVIRYLGSPPWASTVGSAARIRAADFSAAAFARNVVANCHCLTQSNEVNGGARVTLHSRDHAVLK